MHGIGLTGSCVQDGVVVQMDLWMKRIEKQKPYFFRVDTRALTIPPKMDLPYKELWGSNGQDPIPYRGGVQTF